jgi:putative flippase GtrA
MTASTCVDPDPAQAAAAPAPQAGQSLRGPVAEFARYFGCSAVAFGVDVGLYTALLKLAGWGFAGAAAVSFIVGLVVVYGLSVKLVFRTRRLADARAEFTVFAAIGAVGLLLTQALLWLLVEGLGTEPVLSLVMAAGVVFLVNFSLRKLMLFSHRGSSGGTHV